MRKQKLRKTETLANPKDTDPSWAFDSVDGVKVTPQSFVGTHKTIQTAHPNYIEIKYKAKYMLNTYALAADRKYFYILEYKISSIISNTSFLFIEYLNF